MSRLILAHVSLIDLNPFAEFFLGPLTLTPELTYFFAYSHSHEFILWLRETRHKEFDVTEPLKTLLRYV